MTASNILSSLTSCATKTVDGPDGRPVTVRSLTSEQYATLTAYVMENGEGEPEDEYEFDGLSLIDGMPEAGIQRLTPGLTELIVRDSDFDAIA